MNDYEIKQQERRDRYAAQADKARDNADRLSSEANRTASFIPMGQPILVGHHSEKRHRRDLDRIARKQDQAFSEHKKAQHYDRKSESYGTHSISSDDPEASAKLQTKLDGMEAKRSAIKLANRVARKAGKEAAPSYVLQNLGANIRRVRDRIKVLEDSAKQPEVAPVECDGFTIEECTTDNRLRFIFDGKPSAEVRKIMKSNGFRWAPSVGAWQRQLTNSARYSAQCCQRSIAAL